MEKLISEWKATASGEAEGRTITLVGDGEAPTTGYDLKLSVWDEGITDEADLVAVRLTVTEPHGEVNEVVTPTHVEITIRDPATEVRIYTPWGDEGAKVRQ